MGFERREEEWNGKGSRDRCNMLRSTLREDEAIVVDQSVLGS